MDLSKLLILELLDSIHRMVFITPLLGLPCICLSNFFKKSSILISVIFGHWVFSSTSYSITEDHGMAITKNHCFLILKRLFLFLKKGPVHLQRRCYRECLLFVNSKEWMSMNYSLISIFTKIAFTKKKRNIINQR